MSITNFNSEKLEKIAAPEHPHTSKRLQRKHSQHVSMPRHPFKAEQLQRERSLITVCRILSQIEAELPDAELRVKARAGNGSGIELFTKLSDGGQKYLHQRNADEMAEAALLLRKHILSVRKEALENNLALLAKLAGKWRADDTQEIMGALPESYRKAIALMCNYTRKSISSDVSGEHADASTEAFFSNGSHSGSLVRPIQSENPAYPEQLRYQCINGLFVRSKNEAFIAEQLIQAELPFYYERALRLRGENGSESFLYPDFTIDFPDGARVFWEHKGLMDQKVYCARDQQKMDLYRQNGFRIGIDILCTEDGLYAANGMPGAYSSGAHDMKTRSPAGNTVKRSNPSEDAAYAPNFTRTMDSRTAAAIVHGLLAAHSV